MVWLIVIGVIAMLLIYIAVIRPVIVNAPFFSDAFKAEATFWEKVQAYITGWRTKMTTRSLTIAGIIVGLYDQVLPLVSSQDWTPVTAHLPGWVLPVGMVTAGLVFGKLRSLTENTPHVITAVEDGQVKVMSIMQPTTVVE